jgi:uncharacterized ParB-like nuclease family protein
MDAGMEAMSPASKGESEATSTIATAPEVSKTVLAPEKAETASTNNPVDLLTKRLTGKEEPIVSDDSDIKTPDNLKPEAQTAWARLTKDLRDTRAKLKEMESKITEAPNNSVEQLDLKNQLDRLKSERDEYENELKYSRLESTREYKQAVTEPLNNIQQEINDIASSYQVDPRSIYAAMTEPDPAKRRAMLKDATASFDPVDALALRTKGEDLQKVFARRDLMTQDVNTVLQMIESQEKEEYETAQKQYQVQTAQAYDSEWNNFQKDNPLLQPIPDNEPWNNTLKGIQSKALEIESSELDPNTKARLTFHAAAMPVVMNVFQDYVQKSQAKIAELEALAKELRSVTPSAGTNGTGSNVSPEEDASLSFLDALERGMNRR